jgi:hypothetical protein
MGQVHADDPIAGTDIRKDLQQPFAPGFETRLVCRAEIAHLLHAGIGDVAPADLPLVGQRERQRRAQRIVATGPQRRLIDQETEAAEFPAAPAPETGGGRLRSSHREARQRPQRRGPATGGA